MSSTPTWKKPASALPRAWALEPRLMFDAAALTTAAKDVSAAQVAADRVHDAARVQAGNAEPSVEVATVAAAALPATARELVFVDARVQDAAALAQIARPGTEVVVLHDGSDPWTQMSAAIAQRQDVSAIHLLSHGVAGGLVLGGEVYDAAAVQARSAELQAWRPHLAAGADLLLYGCDTGAGSGGAALLQTLSLATGADVAASVDDTGAAALGGDWTLERQTGAIEAQALAAQAWDHLLTAPSIVVPNGAVLDFSAGVRVSGTDRAVNAVYKFDNVVTVGGTQVDAYVTIVAVTNASITTFDDDSPNGTASTNYTLTNQSGGSYTVSDAKFFSPVITTTVANGKVDFRIAFKDTGGNPVVLSNFYNNSIDIDSAEFVEYGGFTSYEMGAPTDLRAIAGSGTQLRFTQNTGANYSGLVLNDTGRVQTKFDGVSTLTISMGATAPSTDRQYGSVFAYQAYSPASVVTSAPTVSALVTADTTPALTGTVGNTVLGTGETFSVTVNGTTYSRGNANLVISGTNWTLNVPTALPAGTFDVAVQRGAALLDQTSNELTVQAVPVVGGLGGDSVSFTEGGNAVLLDSGANATVTDTDSADFSGGSVTVALTANRQAGEDVLGIRHQGTGAGQIGVSGSSVTYGGTAIGTFTGGTGSSDLVVSLNASATPAAVQALLRNLTYADTNTADPATTARTVRVTVNDGTAGASIPADITVNVVPVNDAPTLAATGAAVTYTEDGTRVDLFSGVSASTVESGQLIKALQLTVAGVMDGASEVLRIDGQDVALVAGVTTTTSSGLNVAVTLASGTATVNVSKSAGLSTAAVQTLVDNLAYRNASQEPGGTTRTVTLTQVQDNGGTANGGQDTATLSLVATVTVRAVNDAPAGTDKTLTVSASGAYTFTAANFGFTDTDGDALSAVVITSLPSVGSLTLYGSAVTAGQSVSAADIVAGRLEFTPAAGASGSGYDSFTFQVQDDGGTANGGVDTDVTANTLTFNIASAPHQAPSGTDTTLTVVEDGSHTFAVNDFGFSDAAETVSDNFASVTIATLPSVGRLTLNGSAVAAGQSVSVADINAGLLVFTPAANAHGSGYASFTFQVQDDGGTAGGGADTDATAKTITLDVTPVNDLPLASDDTAATLKGTPVEIDVTANDTDVDADPLTATEVNGTALSVGLPVSVTGGQVSLGSNGRLTFTPASGTTGPVSFNVTVSDGQGGTAVSRVDVTVRPVSISAPVVNEASDWAVFTVTAPAGEQFALSLLEGGTGQADVDQTQPIQVWNGSVWVDHDPQNPLPVPAGGQLLVRVDITQEHDTVAEGPETFVLRATHGSGTVFTGTATIHDDGTGQRFPGTVTGGLPDVAMTALDDDRALVVSSPSVNEASPYAVFTVNGTPGQSVTLALTNGSAMGGGSDFGSSGNDNLQVWDGLQWVDYSAAVSLPAGGTLLVRTPVTNDAVAEGAEAFTLTAAFTGGAPRTATGTATIYDDGTGTLYTGTVTTGAPDTSPSGLDDDRTLVVSSPSVNEASPYAVFTVTGTAGQAVTLQLADGTAQGGSVDYGSSGSLALELWDGSQWVAYGGSATIANSGSLLVRTPVTNDTVAEGAEAFTLTAAFAGGAARNATGTATIHDDGTGMLYAGTVTTGTPDVDTSTTPDDDRTVSVSSPSVNEASPYAVFTVTGTAGQSVSLQLAGGSATGTGTDFGSATSTNLQAWDGLQWVDYTGVVTLPGGGVLLVRTPVVNDNVSDNNETFTLTVSPVGGQATAGTATIHDDGTGTLYTGTVTTGAPDVDTASPPDDDRGLTVSSPSVNEGSGWAVWEIGGAANQRVTLALIDGTTSPADHGSTLQLWNGSSWTPYASSATLNGTGRLLVRASITPDTVYEGSETLVLRATNTGGTATAGNATIHDDGTGVIYTGTATGGTPDVDTASDPDDDRTLAVSSPSVNEASPWAVFTVTGTPGQRLSLQLAGGTATAAVDFGTATLQVSTDGGASWQAYAPGVAMPAGGQLLVRTDVVNDGVSEGAETSALTATPVGGHAATGTATLRDDATGTVFGPTGQPDSGATPDDDRAVAVSSITVNEASPWAVFTVAGTAGQRLDLVLAAGTATGAGVDFGATGATNLQFSTDGGANWQAVTGTVTLPGASGAATLQVRTPVVNDAISDDNETFTLTATPVGGHAATGTATLHDDATGMVFGPTGQPDFGATPDDDRAVAVSSITVNEASPWAVFTVTGTAGQRLSLQLAGGTATAGTDFGTAPLQVPTDGGTTWQAYVPGVAMPAGGQLLVRTDVVNDGVNEGAETFTLTATPVGGHAATGTATIRDDSTGTVFGPTGQPDLGATPDDDRAVAVSSVQVNEASPYAVFVVTGTAGQRLNLQLAGGSANAAVDFGTALLQVSIDGGTTWQAYAPGVAMPAGGQLLVRTDVVNDGVSEGPETFTLIATPVGGHAAAGTATLRDDGTGDVFTATGTVDAAALRDDDRALQVSSVTVNEASPYAIFTVTGSAGQRVQLRTVDGSADGQDYGGPNPAQPQLEVFDGTRWTAYAPGQWVALDGGGRLLVRAAITNDSLDEGDHDFRLQAKTTGGGSFSGTATINDRGAGEVFLAGNTRGTPDAPGSAGYPQLDDDRVRATLPPAAPAAVAPAPAPAPVEPPPAPAPAAPTFDSTLGLPRGSGVGEALRPVEPAAPMPAETRSTLSDGRDVGEIYTRSSGFRTMVTPAAEPALRLFNGVSDQLVPAAKVVNVQVPADVFVHTQANETVTLTATQADGRPLPAWLHFDGKSGTFSGEPPAGGRALDLRLKVTGRDSQGREANAVFRLKAEPASPSRSNNGAVQRVGGLDAQLMRNEALVQRGGQWQTQRFASTRRAG